MQKFNFVAPFIFRNKIIRSTDALLCEPVALLDTQNEIESLNPNKETTHKNIFLKTIRQSEQATANILQLLFNNALSNNTEYLKLADTTPVFKKKDPLEKSIDLKDYRPVRFLPSVLKFFERLM